MRISIYLIFVLSATSAIAQQAHEVHGYVKSDGTYVAPHYQTNPDATRLNNYSTQGNVNPYTGQPGTVNPYAPKPITNPYAVKPAGSPY